MELADGPTPCFGIPYVAALDREKAGRRDLQDGLPAEPSTLVRMVS